MAETTPSFVDRTTAIIGDFQHAMNSNAPVSIVMMGDLRAVLDIAVKAHAACVAMHAKAALAEAKAAQLQSEASDLVATIHGGQ